MTPIRRVSGALSIVPFVFIYHSIQAEAQSSSAPMGTSIVHDGSSLTEDRYLVAVQMAQPDGSGSGVCVVDVAPTYSLGHYFPEPHRIDLVVVVRKHSPLTSLWLTDSTANTMDRPIFTIAGNVGRASAVEFIQMPTDFPEDAVSFVSQVDGEIIQIVSDPAEPTVWLSRKMSEDPPRTRLTSYTINPNAPGLSEFNVSFEAEMDGEMIPGTLAATVNLALILTSA